MKIHFYDAHGHSPKYARVVVIQIGNFTIHFPLPYLEVYTYHPMKDSLPGDIEPFRLFPPDSWWRDIDGR